MDMTDTITSSAPTAVHRATARAQGSEIALRRARTDIRAPEGGIVSRRTARVGATASAVGEPMFRLIARGEIELHQCVNRLRSRIHDVQETLVGPDLELLARLLVDVRGAVDGKFVDSRRQRDRPANLRARALGRRHDLARRSVENAVVKRLEADANILTVHLV